MSSRADADAVPQIVRALIDAGVRRLEQLEVLLIASRDPARAWDGHAVAAASTTPVDVAAAALLWLEKQGLLQQIAGRPAHYRLAGRVDLAELALLRRVHERDRGVVTHAFFAGNLESLRAFASTFRRKPE